MRLSFIGEGEMTTRFLFENVKLPGILILEGYGRVKQFYYDAFGSDPRPRVLVLASYRHRSTGRRHVAGININNLTDKQIVQLRTALPSILKAKQRDRYDIGASLLPDIFHNSYRTYDKTFIHGVVNDTLTVVPSKEMIKQRKEAAKKGVATRRARAKIAKADEKPAAIKRVKKLEPKSKLDADELARKDAAEDAKEIEKKQKMDIKFPGDTPKPDIDMDVDKVRDDTAEDRTASEPPPEKSEEPKEEPAQKPAQEPKEEPPEPTPEPEIPEKWIKKEPESDYD
jgi:hypothetical protein